MKLTSAESAIDDELFGDQDDGEELTGLPEGLLPGAAHSVGHGKCLTTRQRIEVYREERELQRRIADWFSEFDRERL